MTHVFRIEDSNPYAKSIVAFLKTLDFVHEDTIEKSVNFPSMTEQEIIDQAIRVNSEIEQGKFISQKELEKKAKKW